MTGSARARTIRTGRQRNDCSASEVSDINRVLVDAGPDEMPRKDMANTLIDA